MNDMLQKIHQSLQETKCTAWLLTGADTISYAVNLNFPMAYVTPGRIFVLMAEKTAPLVICPDMWASSMPSYVQVHAYKNSPSVANANKTLLAVLKNLSIQKLGIDMERANHALISMLGSYDLCDISATVQALRAVKSAQETALLEELAYCADHAILGAGHHSLACDARAEKGQSELIRLHSLERGFEAMGYNGIAQSATGSNTHKFWAESPKFGIGQGKRTARGEFNRLDLQGSKNGYWAFGSRLMTMGWPTPAQSKAYEGLVSMRKAAIAAMVPGATFATIHEAMLEAAKKAGVTPLLGIRWGHSIGVCAQEAPFITQDEHSPIKEGMVLVLAPHILTSDDEILYSRDTILVNFNGCSILGWYKDWREPYIASDSYYSGGG